MERKTFENVNNLIVSSEKNVYLRTWDSDLVEVRYKPNRELLKDLTEEGFKLSSESHLMVSVPGSTTVRLETIGGNSVLAGNFADVVVDEVYGNFELSTSKTLKIHNVNGNCSIGHVNDRFEIDNVGGNLTTISEEGVLQANNVGGNLNLVGAKVQLISKCGGNAKVSVQEFIGEQNEIRVGGNIKIELKGEPNFIVEGKCGGAWRVELADKKLKGLSKSFSQHFGEGSVKLNLRAGGNINLSSENDLNIRQPQIKNYDDNQWDELENKIESKFDMNINVDLSDMYGLEREIKSEVNKKTKLAEVRIQKALDKINRKVGGSVNDRQESTSQYQETSKVTEEERLIVLKMLQEKKINAEEADRLLRALED